MPFFSIIIPSYNRADIIHRAINSVLKQSFSEFELIVVDDGSTDATASIIGSFFDSRIKYLKTDNQGVCAARNSGAVSAVGEYLIFLDSDDEFCPDALEGFYQKLMDKKVDIIFSDIEVRDLILNQKTTISARYPHGKKVSNGFFMSGTFCIDKQLFLSVGGYDPKLKYGENTELKFRLEKNKYSYDFTDKTGLIYYKSESGGSQNLINQAKSNEYIINKHADLFKRHPQLLKNYRQTMAIAYCKLLDFPMARRNMWMAYVSYPYDLKTLIRFLILLIPGIAKKTWSSK